MALTHTDTGAHPRQSGFRPRRSPAPPLDPLKANIHVGCHSPTAPTSSPSDARMAPLTLVPLSLSRKVMDAASCTAVAGVGTVACISGPRRSAASWDPQLATT